LAVSVNFLRGWFEELFWLSFSIVLTSWLTCSVVLRGCRRDRASQLALVQVMLATDCFVGFEAGLATCSAISLYSVFRVHDPLNLGGILSIAEILPLATAAPYSELAVSANVNRLQHNFGSLSLRWKAGNCSVNCLLVSIPHSLEPDLLHPLLTSSCDLIKVIFRNLLV